MTRNYVRYSRVEMTRAMDEAEARLIDQKAPIYQQNGALVQLIRLNARTAEAEASTTGIRRRPGALLVHPVSPHRLLEVFVEHVDFAVWNARKESFVRGAPPLEFARHYEARGMWNLRVLAGIVEAPTLRPDGTILYAPGYDEETGLYLDTGGVEFPTVPDRPSRDDAEQALAFLKDVIKDFPFVPDEEDAELGAPSAGRSVALAAILTVGCRQAVRTAPAFGFDATSMETGKTLLCNAVSLIWLGRDAAAMSQGATEEEFDKRLFSMLLQGDPIVLIDDIDNPVKSDEFCKVLTSPTVQGRVLGVSANRTVSTARTFLLNGNGLTFEGDMRTRVLLGRLDARVEEPGKRRFDRNLLTWIPENRTALVSAVLTVLRSFIVAGRPSADKLSVFGRFEEWSNLVRASLVWLGEPDPCQTRSVVAVNDPERAKLAALLLAWSKVFPPGKWVTAKELMDDNPYDEDVVRLDDARRALVDAIEAITPYRSVNVWGRYLTRYTGRIVDGRRIKAHATTGHSTKYTLEFADDDI